MMVFDAFISYSSKDKVVADAACAALEAAGIRCWIAPRDITPGSDWGASIVEALDQCRVMVLIFSSSANTSPQIRREIERVVNRGVALLPVRIEDIVPTKAMAYFMGPVHWLDALTPPLEQHFHRLAESIKVLLASDAQLSAMGDPAKVPASPPSTAAPSPGSADVSASKPVDPPSGASVDAAGKLPRNLALPVLVALAIGSGITLLFLLAQDTGNFTAAAVVTGAVYWFVYRNLATDVATAKIALVGLSGIIGYFVLINLVNRVLWLAVSEAITAGCLLYVLSQLLEREKRPR